MGFGDWSHKVKRLGFHLRDLELDSNTQDLELRVLAQGYVSDRMAETYLKELNPMAYVFIHSNFPDNAQAS